ncbi:MAG: hypothetical protein Kow0069_30920 [Promethearchaeota archaeon]
MLDAELFSTLDAHLAAQKQEGKRVAAYLAHELVPVPLLEAAGVVPLPLIFAGTEELTHEGTVHLSPTTCVFARSIVGAFEPSNRTGKWKFLDHVDALLCLNYCNAENVAVETICRVHGLKRFDFFLPNSTLGKSLKLAHERLVRLRRELEEWTGREVRDEEVWRAINRQYEAKRVLGEVLRSDLPGSDKLELFQRAALMGARWVLESPQLSAFRDGTPRNAGNGRGKGRRVVLSGCSFFMGDPLADVVEEAGFDVAVDDTWLGTRYLSDAVQPGDGGDPLVRLLDAYAKDGSIHFAPNALSTTVGHVASLVRELGVKGVLHHQIKFCDLFPFVQDRYRPALQGTGASVLWIERDYAAKQSAQLLTRLEAFGEILEEGGGEL